MRMYPRNEISMQEFAGWLHRLLHSDRDINIACGGDTGVGKSTFAMKLLKAYSKVSGMPWDFSQMTWQRSELMAFIDGEPGSEKVNGLRKGQLPEYSGILADELFTMFYRRNWASRNQIDAITTFNMARDRHLLVVGNVPSIWKLDSAFVERIRYYIYIPRRGIAWIFESNNNPWLTDNWNQSENAKAFTQAKNTPYSCPNYRGEIRFGDLNAKDKEAYLTIRNEKRVIALEKQPEEETHKYLEQRNALIKDMVENRVKKRHIAKVIGVQPSQITNITHKKFKIQNSM